MSYEYHPRGGALALFKCRDPEVLIEGAAGTGKTRAILQKIHALAEKYPRSRHLLCRQTRISMNETVLNTWEKIVLPPGHSALGGADRSHKQRYTYANGSEVLIGGLDNAERILSAEYDTAGLFEATECCEDDWEKLLTRVGRNKAMPYSQAFADCNPASPGHWLNQRALRGLMHRIASTHADNPSLTPEYLAKLERLTGTRRARFFLGQWVGSEGVVYDTFDLALHVKADSRKPVRVVLGVDDGTRNPFACLRAHIDGDGGIHIAAERYRSGLLESGKVDAVKALADGAECVYVDPAAAGLKLALRNANVPVADANNDVLQGIARVQDRLADVRLTIDPSCVNLVNEMQAYEWLENDKRDVPRKEGDHAVDCARYICSAIDCSPSWAAITHEPVEVGRDDDW